MVALKLVRLIESHSEELADALVVKLHTSERTPAYRNIPSAELRNAVLDVYQNLGDWLMTKTESDVELRYKELGQRRVLDVPLSQFMASMLMTKEHLWSYLHREAMSNGALELYGELEFLQALNTFYDKAIYYASMSYDQKQVGQVA